MQRDHTAMALWWLMCEPARSVAPSPPTNRLLHDRGMFVNIHGLISELCRDRLMAISYYAYD